VTGGLFTAECRAGRLVELRLTTLNDADDVVRWEAAVQGVFAKLGRKCVICAHSGVVAPFSPEVSRLLVGVMARTNAHVERSALLLLPNRPLSAMQQERVVREAKGAARRTFRDARPMVAWLSEVLDNTELARLRAFLSSP
jgi:hypothetical protein